MIPKSRVEAGSGSGSALSSGAISAASAPSAPTSDAAGESIYNGCTWASAVGAFHEPPSASVKPRSTLMFRVICRGGPMFAAPMLVAPMFAAYDMTAKELLTATSTDIYLWTSPNHPAFGIEHQWDTLGASIS